jgi:hypothetical protein
VRCLTRSSCTQGLEEEEEEPEVPVEKPAVDDLRELLQRRDEPTALFSAAAAGFIPFDDDDDEDADLAEGDGHEGPDEGVETEALQAAEVDAPEDAPQDAPPEDGPAG